MLTMPSPQDMLGSIDAVRCNSGQKCAIVWRWRSREVWLDEVAAIGRKRALYQWHRQSVSQSTLRLLWRLEGEAHEVLDDERKSADEYAPTIEDERIAAMAVMG